MKGLGQTAAANQRDAGTSRRGCAPSALMRAALLCLGLALGACASQQRPAPPPQTQESAPEAAPAEFENSFGDSIPEVLERAMRNAYALPQPLSCASLLSEVQALEAVLCEDLDTRPGEPLEPDLMSGAIMGAIKGAIPYRGWLMQLSGENSRSRRGVAAITAGHVRRAYLKGLGESLGCPAPASPQRPPQP